MRKKCVIIKTIERGCATHSRVLKRNTYKEEKNGGNKKIQSAL